MNRGDVCWYTFRAPDKRRPVLVLTRDSAIKYLTDITVVSITSTIRGTPSEVLLTPTDGLANDCAINLYNIHTVPKVAIGPFIAHLSPDKMRAVQQAIQFALGFDALEE